MGLERAKEGKYPSMTPLRRDRRRRSLTKAPKFLLFGKNLPVTRGDLEHKKWTHRDVFINRMDVHPRKLSPGF